MPESQIPVSAKAMAAVQEAIASDLRDRSGILEDVDPDIAGELVEETARVAVQTFLSASGATWIIQGWSGVEHRATVRLSIHEFALDDKQDR